MDEIKPLVGMIRRTVFVALAAFREALLERVGQERMWEIGEEYEPHLARTHVPIACQDHEPLIEE